VEAEGTSVWGYHPWFSNERMRAFVDGHGLLRARVALCRECHGALAEEVLEAYRAPGEGARLPEDVGRSGEASELLARRRS
jgi:hypothetical protein